MNIDMYHIHRNRGPFPRNSISISGHILTAGGAMQQDRRTPILMWVGRNPDTLRPITDPRFMYTLIKIGDPVQIAHIDTDSITLNVIDQHGAIFTVWVQQLVTACVPTIITYIFGALTIHHISTIYVEVIPTMCYRSLMDAIAIH